MFIVPYEQFMRKVHALVISEDNCGFYTDTLKYSDRPSELDKLRRIYKSQALAKQRVNQPGLDQVVDLCRLGELQILVALQGADSTVQRRYPEVGDDP